MISSFIAIMVGMFTIMASAVRSSSVYRTSNRRSNNNNGLSFDVNTEGYVPVSEDDGVVVGDDEIVIDSGSGNAVG